MRVTLSLVLLAAVVTVAMAPGWALANAGGTEPPEVVEGPAAATAGDAAAPETVEAPVTAVPVPAAEGAAWYDELKDWVVFLVPAIVIVAAAATKASSDQVGLLPAIQLTDKDALTS